MVYAYSYFYYKRVSGCIKDLTECCPQKRSCLGLEFFVLSSGTYENVKKPVFVCMFMLKMS